MTQAMMNNALSIKQALTQAVTQLATVSDEAPLETALLLGFVLHIDQTTLQLRQNDPLTKVQLQQFLALIDRRLSHEPLAYLVGEKEFYKQRFFVSSDVLIPRPETEQMIDLLHHFIKEENLSDVPITIADIGTGSGILAVTAAWTLPNATVIATDISERAIAVAKQNAMLHHVIHRIDFRHGSLLDPLTKLPAIILTNLPYVPHSRIQTLAPEVKDWEPTAALDGGPDGFALYKTLLEQIAACPTPPLFFLGEIDASHAEIARTTADRLFPTATVTVMPDYAGVDRFLVIQW